MFVPDKVLALNNTLGLRVVAACPAGDPLTRVHMFEAARFVPIGNTPVRLDPLLCDMAGEQTFGESMY